MQTPKTTAVGWVTRYASGLRFPALLAIFGSLFLLDLLIPDLVPFADEVLLGLFTLLLATLRRKPSPVVKDKTAVTIDVEPAESEDRGKRG